jgi:PAS domain-containing protein
MGASPHGNRIDAEHQADRTLEHSRRLLDAIYRGNLAGLIESTEAGAILDCNDAFARMLGYASGDELKSLNAGQLYYVPVLRSRRTPSPPRNAGGTEADG